MKNFFKKLFCSDSWSKNFSETVRRVGKNNAGFSLVELIVVIAIMAILAAVAVVGVSVYIPKAQQANDKQLFADIEDALIYAGYAGTFDEGASGYIVLSKDGVVNTIPAGSALDVALTDSFGANYKTELKLAYEKWANNGVLNGVSPLTAYAVSNSSYLTGNRVDSLLGDVEKMTNMATNLVTVLGQNSGVTEGMTLSGMFTKDGNCAIDATAAKYGVSKGNYATWEDWAAASPENNRTYSNLLVLTAADESQNKLDADNAGEDYEMTNASDMIVEFSSFYAFAATNDAFSARLDEYMAQLNDGTTVTNATTGAAWYNALKAEADSYGYSDYLNDSNGQADMDKAGFLSIMAGIGNPNKEQADAIANDISNENLFTTGVVSGMYNDYLDYVDSVNGMFSGDIEDASNFESIQLDGGNVAILFTYRNGVVEVKTTVPAQN